MFILNGPFSPYDFVVLISFVIVRKLEVLFLAETLHVQQDVLGVRCLVELPLDGEVPPHVHLGRRRCRRRLLREKEKKHRMMAG